MRYCGINEKIQFTAQKTRNRQKRIHHSRRTQKILQQTKPNLRNNHKTPSLPRSPIRVFKGIFYIKTPEETKFHTQKYNHLELTAKGLELKGVKNWYFGLHTALKLNNLTHEYFTIDNVINDKLLRSNPIKIAGYKYKFTKLAPKLLDFGIIKNNNYQYSDPEKTILDFIYTWRYNGVPKERIVMDISDWAKNISKEKIKRYTVNYPKTVQEIVDMMLVSSG